MKYTNWENMSNNERLNTILDMCSGNNIDNLDMQDLQNMLTFAAKRLNESRPRATSYDERFKELSRAAQPVIDYLNLNYDSDTYCVIDWNSARLFQSTGLMVLSNKLLPNNSVPLTEEQQAQMAAFSEKMMKFFQQNPKNQQEENKE